MTGLKLHKLLASPNVIFYTQPFLVEAIPLDLQSRKQDQEAHVTINDYRTSRGHNHWSPGPPTGASPSPSPVGSCTLYSAVGAWLWKSESILLEDLLFQVILLSSFTFYFKFFIFYFKSSKVKT